MSTFTVTDETAARARGAAEHLIEAGDQAIAEGLKFPQANYKVVLGAYGWWRLVNRASLGVLTLIDRGFTAPEVAPLMRNIFNHAYALNWLVDNGEAAVDAVMSAGATSREKLLKKLERTGWAIAAQYGQTLDQQAAEPTRTAAEQSLHDKLVHEIGHVHDLLDRYGVPDLYPVYSHLSSLSHTSVDTASAYLAELDDGTVQIRATAADLGPADVFQLAISLIQAGRVFSPLLDGDPLKAALDTAISDIGVDTQSLLPRRVK
ncbi:DUF5677 domain-containing protein [Actinacidiphila oryziradicis]|uniref:Uncharacterized protein n=1 Tax=Actinacidiphila oryziradicis TaxID=2571141 RepID=A0A4U0RZ56_9ACTN|nr:DUF5677 domain-containing protein [Actinacidiphila oryziradicis]TKA00111.1 hypothetical protein FCI23_43575 [Actinacidiphila oryziradicis]